MCATMNTMVAPSKGGWLLAPKGWMSSFKDSSEDGLRTYRFGWYGDSGLGEVLLNKILSGEKTASTCPTYDPEDVQVGEVLRLVDKTGKDRGKIRITHIEVRRWDQFNEKLAAMIGASLDDIARMTAFANSRDIGPDEEMRVTYFELVK
jgi:uncharacterized protein YhfF